MTIEMRLETLRMWRREIDIGLKVAAERSFYRTTEIRKRRQTLVHLGKRDRGTGSEQLVRARQVNSAGRFVVGKRVILGLELTCRVNQEHVRTARGRRREISIDCVNAQ